MRKALCSAVCTVAGAAVYVQWIRPWFLTWGASDEEVAADLPGDDLVTAPRTTSTRAISIQATPDEVWPWLAQMGQGRGGLYSYEWIENLVGCDLHNADQVIPELQEIAPGDRIRLFPESDDLDLSLEVAVADPGRALVLRTPGTKEDAFAAGLGFASWAFVVVPDGPDAVRLVVRWRCDFEPTFANALAWKWALEPVHFVMERKMLDGIRTRAEELARRHRAVEALDAVHRVP